MLNLAAFQEPFKIRHGFLNITTNMKQTAVQQGEVRVRGVNIKRVIVLFERGFCPYYKSPDTCIFVSCLCYFVLVVRSLKRLECGTWNCVEDIQYK